VALRGIRLSPGRPNPFRGTTLLAYELFLPSPVRLTIFDLAGRTVRRLVDAPLLPAGSHSVVWDGRDDQGRMVAGGVYFSRLEGGGTSEAYRVVRLE
jgi:flagellar hook assembly protein FlgD